ncbi:hypothetical protein J7E93_06705 [Streptomyces sp. ISL-36]|uniref:hypothetical protein n=1 Tax=Streptomyces sp. ISL-36 TaxID=2819182 RepID=UPI001BEBEE30|nr:hypothetical protein [Streptomyces sp. ISL-36]MBT2439816.1 hypothetical protein [Streptomyces sp. ISL-36]
MTRPSVPRPTNARALDEHGVVVRGAEPAPATTVMRGMVYGSGLTHALDYVVLLHTLFRLEENQAFTPKDIWRDLQEEGVRSAKNANELVGRDAVYESFNRLIDAKFIRRVTVGGAPGRFGKVRYELYRQPAYNPDFAPPKEPWEPQEDPNFPHATEPLPGTPDADKADGKTAGRTASRNAGTGKAVSGVPGSGRKRIPAGRTASGVPGSGHALPPTPPRGEEGTSPSEKQAPAAPGGEGSTVRLASEEQVQAASEFLMELKRPWAVGRKLGKTLGAELAEALLETGWELDASLALWLCRTEDGKKAPDNHKAVLRHRIEQLERRSSIFPPAGATEAGGSIPSARLAIPDWCGECNRGERPRTLMERLIDVGDDEQQRCPKCHPAVAGRSQPSE